MEWRTWGGVAYDAPTYRRTDSPLGKIVCCVDCLCIFILVWYNVKWKIVMVRRWAVSIFLKLYFLTFEIILKWFWESLAVLTFFSYLCTRNWDASTLWAATQHSSSELGSAFILHHSCTVKERNAVSLKERRRFTWRKRPYRSETDRVMTKGAKVGALSESTNL